MQAVKLMEPESILDAHGASLISGWEELVREGKEGSLPLPKWAPPLSLVRKREGGEAGKFASPLAPLLRLVLMGAIFRGQQSH